MATAIQSRRAAKKTRARSRRRVQVGEISPQEHENLLRRQASHGLVRLQPALKHFQSWEDRARRELGQSNRRPRASISVRLTTAGESAVTLRVARTAELSKAAYEAGVINLPELKRIGRIPLLTPLDILTAVRMYPRELGRLNLKEARRRFSETFGSHYIATADSFDGSFDDELRRCRGDNPPLKDSRPSPPRAGVFPIGKTYEMNLVRDGKSVVLDVGPVRDQGGRGTCTAFSIVGVMERHDPNSELSEQFLYWSIKTDPKHPHHRRICDGATLAEGVRALSRRGICGAEFWPYSGAQISGSITHEVPGKSPDRCAIDDASQRRQRWGSVSSTWMPQSYERNRAQRIYSMLRSGRPVAVSLPVLASLGARQTNWLNPSTKLSGVLVDPAVDPMPDMRLEFRSSHAVVIMGFHPAPDMPGGGVFLFRNSWGPGWAFDAANQFDGRMVFVERPGYGQCSASFVEECLLEAWQP